jgi:hypothetical protein
MAVDQVPPNEPSILEYNREHLRRKLEHELHEFETRYELTSDRVQAELQAGRLRDTADICRWIIAYETYQAIGAKPDEQPA